MTGSPLDPAVHAAEIEKAAHAANWTVRHLSPCASGPRPWLHRAGPQADAPRLYLSAGIHGDEIAGPLAVLEMVRQAGFFRDFDTTIFPILNPDGIARGTRENAEGIDLNRDYRNPKSAEIRSHLEVLETLSPFAAAIYLHEDFEGTGAYIYELNEALAAPPGPEIIAAMSRHVPIDLRPMIEDVSASGGILSRKELMAKHGALEDRPDWPEALYMSRRHTKVSITTETPMLVPLEQRVKAQMAAVGSLMGVVKGMR